MTQVAASLAAALEELPPNEVEEFRSALEANVPPHLIDSGLTFPGVTINAAAS